MRAETRCGTVSQLSCLRVVALELAEAALGVEERSSPLTIRAQRRGRQTVLLRVAATGRGASARPH